MAWQLHVCPCSVRVAFPKNCKLWKAERLEIRLAGPDHSTVEKSLVLLPLFQYHTLKQFYVYGSGKCISSFAEGRQLVTLIFLLGFENLW